MKKYKILIGSEWIDTGQKMKVINPYNNRDIATVCVGGEREVDQAIKVALRAFETTRTMSSKEVSGLLKRVCHGIIRRREEFVNSIIAEAGKPKALAEQEVDRSTTTFSIASEEASRIVGEYLPIDIDDRSEGRVAITRRFPVGVVGCITPFNFPLNLVAHKVAPAIAARNCIVLKPASKTPITALLLGEVLLEAGMTPGQLNIVPCKGSVGEALATDSRVAKLTFTGSPDVGWRLKNIAGRKKVTLELGGNAAVVVHSDADLKWAVPRIVAGAYGYAGQTCISVQRILIHKSIYDKTVKALVKEIKTNARTGAPASDKVMAGPMIDKASLDKIGEWVREACDDGAKILVGGKKKGRGYMPTLLSNVKRNMRVVCSEVFAPVATVQSYGTFDQAMRMINDSDFGLQAGVFTNDINLAFQAFEQADVGGVIINDFPTFRVDNMPYGGVKDSGLGREGVKYAIEEMTEMKVMVIKK